MSPSGSPPGQLSPLQLACMRVLWSRGEATVAEVTAELSRKRSLAPNTVATVLSRLEKQGLCSHETRGRKFVYRPAIAEEEARSAMVGELTERVFDGDVSRLVHHLLAAHEMQPGDLEAVRALLDRKTAERKTTRAGGESAEPRGRKE